MLHVCVCVCVCVVPEIILTNTPSHPPSHSLACIPYTLIPVYLYAVIPVCRYAVMPFMADGHVERVVQLAAADRERLLQNGAFLPLC